MLLDFSYRMTLEFSDPVEDQYFVMRCIPRDTDRQKLTALNTEVEPDTVIHRDTDGLGNRMLYGLIREEHDRFCLSVSGTVETTGSLYEEYEDRSSADLFRYLTPSGYTQPGQELLSVCRMLTETAPDDDYGRLLHFAGYVRDNITYLPGATDVHTTAEAALKQRKGVCQDYAHVLIALLRLTGIPARYVAGLMRGEGESHAWVEANCNGYWYGIDPTNNLLTDDSYIKFSHGRDYEDCMVSRGIFRNPRAMQTMGIAVSVVPGDQETAPQQ